MNLRWVDSAGGPLVCGGPSTAKVWRGIAGSSISALESDYDRACSQLDYVNIVPSGNFEVVVLGDEPLQSSFLIEGDEVAIARWVSCVSGECAKEMLAHVPLRLPVLDKPKRFRLNEFGLIMFDSAIDRVGFDGLEKVQLSPGLFEIASELYEVKGVCRFVIHRFVRPAGMPGGRD